MSAANMTSDKKVGAFRREVWKHYKAHGRKDLPWRLTTDPYKILVSEVMLQQTQVPRVIEKYKSFLKIFPNVRSLARSDLAMVLREWNGLGYNRRGKYLHDAAREIVARHKGIVPKEAAELRKLPGMGPYTASAVRVFAFDLPDILIETNVRTAYIHHFFTGAGTGYKGDPFAKLADADLVPVAALAAAGQDSRRWHWALMDYGSHLKRTGIRTNAQSKHYVKQSKFEGSLRQLRGAILRELQRSPRGPLGKKLGITRVPKAPRAAKGSTLDRSWKEADIKKALEGLERDGLIKSEKGKWRIT